MLLLECLLGLIRFLLGAALFSFMNVVAWRLPRNMDPLKGRSICPRCGRTLDAPDLVPVFSWLFLRGRCRHCGAPIPARYLLVEVLGGVLALGCTRQYGAALDLPDGLFGMRWAGACWPWRSAACCSASRSSMPRPRPIPDRLNAALAVLRACAGTAALPRPVGRGSSSACSLRQRADAAALPGHPRRVRRRRHQADGRRRAVFGLAAYHAGDVFRHPGRRRVTACTCWPPARPTKKTTSPSARSSAPASCWRMLFRRAGAGVVLSGFVMQRRGGASRTPPPATLSFGGFSPMPRYRYTATALPRARHVRGVTDAPSAEALYTTLRDARPVHDRRAKPVGSQPAPRLPPAENCRMLAEFLPRPGHAAFGRRRAAGARVSHHGGRARPERPHQAAVQHLIKRAAQGRAAFRRDAPVCARFPELLIAMTRSAEGTGSIDASFLRMGRYYDREHKVNQQVGNSLMYPIILSVMIVGVIAILMGFVVPQFMPMFEQMDSLPLPTVILFAVATLFRPTGCLSFWSQPFCGGRPHRAGPARRAPPVGPHAAARARHRQAEPEDLHGPLRPHAVQPVFQRCPIVATLIASRDAVGNRWIISQFDEVLDKVRAGNSLSESLALVDGFEQSMSSSIAVGEETGKLDELLATISETLDFEARSPPSG